MQLPVFELTFSDGEVFKGDSLKNDWLKVPEKLIKSFRFSWGGVTILLENYLQYNHFLQFELRENKTSILSKILIMARQDNVSEVIEYDLKTKRTSRNLVAVGQEYKGNILPGWREGVKGEVPHFKYGNF